MTLDMLAGGGEITEDEARDLTDQIKVSVGQVWELVAAAYVERAWAALGYASWDAYCSAEFGASRLALPREDRREAVASLREHGLSTRAIGAATGASHNTVLRDLAATGSDEPVEGNPSPIVGVNGKSYAPRGPVTAPEIADRSTVPLDDGEAEQTADAVNETFGPALVDGDVAETLDGNAESKRIPNVPTKPDLGGVSHPARYTSALIPVFAEILRARDVRRVLDPFAGTGRIHELGEYGFVTVGVEIEPEWAALHERTQVGDALHLPFDDGSFDAIVTSPCYGNRLADRHNASDPERRRSYTHDLGRTLSAGSSGGMQWGDEYRAFHTAAWGEAWRVLEPGGLLVLNIKDHIRGGERQYVAGWHVTELCRQGFELLYHLEIEAPSLRAGTNREARVGGELVYVLERDA